MSKVEMFDHWLMGPLLASLGAFPVNRSDGDTESVRRTIDLLNSGEAVLIFPEGTRGDGVTMGPIARGVAMLARKTNAQVIPVGLIGTNLKMPKGSPIPRFRRVTVVYGVPFTYQQVCDDSSEKVNREIFAKELAQRICGLCNAYGLMIKIGETSSGQIEVSLLESQPVP